MTMIDVWVEVEGNCVTQTLHEARAELDAGGDVFLDFSSVRRLDSGGIPGILIRKRAHSGGRLTVSR